MAPMDPVLRLAKIRNCVNTSCDLSGLYMLLGVNPMPIMATVIKRLKSGVVKIEGIFTTTASFVFGSLNISYDFVAPKKKKGSIEFGDVLPNGSWIGHYGNLKRKEMDVYLGPSPLEERLTKDFKLTESYSSLETFVVASEEETRQGSFFNFLLTVDRLTWIFLLSAFVCLVILSSLVDSYQLENERNIFKRMYKYLWVYLAAMFSEGSPKNPPTRQSQGLLMMWLICIIVFNCALFGQFKASVMVNVNDNIMRTVHDILERPNLIPYLVKNFPYEKVFSESSLDHYRLLYQRVLDNSEEAFLSPVEYFSPKVLQNVKDGKGIMVLPEIAFQIAMSMFCEDLEGRQKLYLMEEVIATMDYVFLTNLDFPPYLLNKINERMIGYRAADIAHKMTLEYLLAYRKCQSLDDESVEIHLGLDQLRSLFNLQLLCQGLAFLVLVGEILHNRIRKRLAARDQRVNRFKT